MYKIIILLIMTLLSACQNSNKSIEKFSNNSVDENRTEQYQKKILSEVIHCQSKKSPPVKDKTKIKQLLMKKGTITDDMSAEKIERAINEYIRKKQSHYKECKK